MFSPPTNNTFIVVCDLDLDDRALRHKLNTEVWGNGLESILVTDFFDTRKVKVSFLKSCFSS